MTCIPVHDLYSLVYNTSSPCLQAALKHVSPYRMLYEAALQPWVQELHFYVYVHSVFNK